MAMIFLRVKTDDILQSASISHRESAVLRGKRHLRCDECPPRIPSPHLLRFVWCYKKEGLFEADSITLSFSIQTCSEGTPFSVTPHGRVGWNDGTENLSRRGSRHPRCMKLARREREALENVLFIPAWCHHVITMGKITGLDRLSPLFS